MPPDDDILRLVKALPENPEEGWKTPFVNDLQRLLSDRERRIEDAKNASDLHHKQRALTYQGRSFWIALCSLGLSILGFGAVGVGLYFNARALRSNTQQGMVRIVTDLDRVYIDRPDLLKYFEGGKPISVSDPDYPRVYATAVMFLDVIDIAASQDHTYKSQWKTPGA